MIIYGDDDQNMMIYDGNDLRLLRMSLLTITKWSAGD